MDFQLHQSPVPLIKLEKEVQFGTYFEMSIRYQSEEVKKVVGRKRYDYKEER